VRGGLLAAALAAQIPFFGPLDTSAPVPYWIGAGQGVDGFASGDPALARWALEAWQQAAGGPLAFRPASRNQALVRLQWVSGAGGRYGEMRPMEVGGKRGAEVFVQPSTDSLGEEIAREARRDPLFRDSVVYLTCLHELGHALGLEHTADYADIMYFFGHGGDIRNYFLRYRRLLKTRQDIPKHPGLSSSDVARLRRLYGTPR